MTMDIEVKGSHTEEKRVKAKDCFGADYGVVFQQYFHGKPQKTYLIGTGHADRPISVWWDEEEKEYKISSESKKELKEYLPWVQFKKLPNARVRPELDCG